METVENEILSIKLPINLTDDLYIGNMPNFDLIFVHCLPNLLQFLAENGTASRLKKNSYIFRMLDGRFILIRLESRAIVKIEILNAIV